MTEENPTVAGQPEQPPAPQMHPDAAGQPVEQHAHPVTQPTQPIQPQMPVAQPTQPFAPQAHVVHPAAPPQPVNPYQQHAQPPHNPFALPGGQAPHAPGSFGPFGAPQADPGAAMADSALAGAGGGAPHAPKGPRQRPFWMPLVGTAAAAALVASLATAGIVGAFDHSSSTSPASIA
ncbi:MAG TPA: hypothetical protein VMV41_16750 [Cellulomonadaceae bacterium]|nr:hypothetical protein [Cellulomonadaceae bacterium]